MSDLPEIPGYEILAKIGVGSTATVWRARQESLNRDVAIKVLHPALWMQMEEADAFLAEARSVALLKSRHVLQVYDVGRLDHTAYIGMEFADGYSLAEHLDETGPMQPREAMQVVAAIADALNDAWQTQNMIHRDIKPDNIIIENDGSVKLADLGLARQLDPDLIREEDGEIAGTPNYMSPEQATGTAALSPASDMYSLGATLYHMLCGKAPFSGMSVEKILAAQVSSQLPWLQTINSKIPLSYCQFTARLMMKDPAHRYSSWDKVYTDATKLVEGRMLMIKIPSEGTSTVASPGNTHTPKTKSIRVKTPAKTSGQAKTSGHPSPRYKRKPPVPKMLTRTLGFIKLFVVFAMLWTMLIKPYIASRNIRTLPPPHVTTAPAGPISAQDAEADTYAMFPGTTTANNEDATNAWDSAEQPESALGEPQQTDPMQMQLKILELLAQQLPTQAQQYWQKNASHMTDTETAKIVEELLIPENSPQSLMAQVLSLARVRPITLTIGGQKMPIIVETIEGDLVQAMAKSLAGSSTILRPQSFRISQLPPAEQMGLLKLSKSPYASHARVIAALQSADFPAALEVAPQIESLEPAIREYANSRIERLTQP